jgi:hypothetical protein
MSAQDGLYPAIWFACQSPHHANVTNEVPELLLLELAIFHQFGAAITQATAIQQARSIGWKKIKGKWMCPFCSDREVSA